MYNSVSLNDLYADYTAGLLGRKEFESAIFRIIQEDIQRNRFFGWNKDECDDYVSWLYLRISRAIGSYRETGSSFESYIGTMVRLAAKEYRSRQFRSNAAENAAWITLVPEMYACERGVEYDEYDAMETENLPMLPAMLKNPRQLLILILKCCSHVSRDFLEKIAPSLGIRADTLGSMIDILKHQREKRELEVSVLREKANAQFHRCIFYEKNLSAVAEDSITAQRLRERLERGRKRLTKTRRRLAQARIAPSNLQIAQLLGISKGTVDAVLYNLKVRWKHNQLVRQKTIALPVMKNPRFLANSEGNGRRRRPRQA